MQRCVCVGCPALHVSEKPRSAICSLHRNQLHNNYKQRGTRTKRGGRDASGPYNDHRQDNLCSFASFDVLVLSLAFVWAFVLLSQLVFVLRLLLPQPPRLLLLVVSCLPPLLLLLPLLLWLQLPRNI